MKFYIMPDQMFDSFTWILHVHCHPIPKRFLIQQSVEKKEQELFFLSVVIQTLRFL